MGMVPIPVISTLTFTRSDEPLLEPTVAISRVSAESAETGGQSDEGYSPSDQQASPDQDSDEARSQPFPADPEPAHQVNFFA